MAPTPYIYVRDRILIGQNLVAELKEELDVRNVTAGTPLCFLAREIVHEPIYTFALHKYPLVFVADSYDGKGGAIDTADHESVASAGGNPGQSGGNGASATSITLVAQKVVNARLVATGNEGGAGGKAANGGNGEDASFDKEIHQYFDGWHGQDGAPGGKGGNGGNGGAIALHFVTSGGDTKVQVDAAGGSAGKGGAAGGNGKPGKDLVNAKGGSPGKGGAAGANGKPGMHGKVTKTAMAIEDWWDLVVTLAGKSAASQWSSYRTRVGEYLFRSYVPDLGVPSRAGERRIMPPALAKARRELESALILRAEVNAGKFHFSISRARVLLGYLNHGWTPIGLSYQYDLRPDFDHYEDFITDYQGRRDALFQNALELLLGVKNTGDKANLASLARDHVQGLAGAAQLDVDLAESKVKLAEQLYKLAEQRRTAIKAELNNVALARQEADGEISFGEFMAWASAVVSLAVAVVGTVFTSGGTLAAWLGAFSLVLTTDDADEVSTWLDEDFELTKEGLAMKGKLTKAIEGTAKLVDKVEAVVALANAEGDDKFDEKERQLLIDAFNAAHEMNVRYIEHEQAVLVQASATQKEATYAADKDALDNLVAGFEKDMDAVVKVVRALLRRFHTYVDYFIGYGFRRARAYDIYKLADPLESRNFRFDYGYIHPDIEENAFCALAREDTSRVTGLLAAYVDSLGAFEPAKLRAEYDQYRESLSFGGSETVSITDPTVLASLMGSGIASFEVPYAHFEPHTELKIGQVGIGLVGAKGKAAHQWVKIDLEHGGHGENRRKDGSAVAIKAPARTELGIQAELNPVTPNDLPIPEEKERPMFWGRSPATRWRIEISPDAAEDAGLDLSGLTEIQLAVRYAMHNPTAPVPFKRIRPIRS
jgi:hypothetical protein